MLVLILAAGSFFVFIAVLACLVVAHSLESREITRRRNLWSHRPVKFLSHTQAFEPIYAPLWDAPVSALQLVNSAKNGIPAARLQPSFWRAAASFPEIYEGCEFVRWLEFHECEDLISWDPDS